MEACCQLVSTLKPVSVKSVPKAEEGKDPNGVAAPVREEDEPACPTSGDKYYEGSSFETPAKRMRKMSMELKQCSATGCQKTHFWSKKMEFLP